MMPQDQIENEPRMIRDMAIEIAVERGDETDDAVSSEPSDAAPAWRLQQQGEQQASKRAQTASET